MSKEALVERLITAERTVAFVARYGTDLAAAYGSGRDPTSRTQRKTLSRKKSGVKLREFLLQDA